MANDASTILLICEYHQNACKQRHALITVMFSFSSTSALVPSTPEVLQFETTCLLVTYECNAHWG